ncbi:unnamed protein product [Euphydryas editha]|uniref:Uncharacterized protein n=1 Tax=Euphydryas editha TaxID=104508 RepID=A0AAU9V5K6_EUPED|nr:unnamed protein product [Euphydryas editha]
MLGGAAGGARSRPPTDLHQGVARFPLYSLFPNQGGRSTQIHKVTESLFSTSLSTFGVPTPPPNSPYSPLQLELLNCAQRVFVADKETSKMEESKLGKCLSEPLCCPDQRQLLEGVGMMQPLTIKTEQAKRTCNTCLTNSPKKLVHTDGGCSRTNPVTWLGVAGQNVQVQVKREPQHVHVSELVAVKLEQASPGNKPEQPPPAIPASLNNGSIPVGIAVARQRVGDHAGLFAALSQKDNQRLHDLGKFHLTIPLNEPYIITCSSYILLLVDENELCSDRRLGEIVIVNQRPSLIDSAGAKSRYRGIAHRFDHANPPPIPS